MLFRSSLFVATRAVELDPLSPEASTWLGVQLYLARRYEEAVAELRATLSSTPDFDYARLWLGRAYARMGRYPEAIDELERTQHTVKFGIAEYRSALARVYADAGDVVAARRMLDELQALSTREFVAPIFIALVQIGLSDKDGALDSLTLAADGHSYTVPWWPLDPELDPLRDDARFMALMKTVAIKH